ITSTQKLADREVEFHQDGSISFKVGNQELSVNKDALDYYNIAIETSGAAGIEDLISDIAYMIEKCQSKYPTGEMPKVELMFGTSDRISAQDDLPSYQGKATVNSTTIKIGNDMLVIQKDQNCTASRKHNCYFQDEYKIEGSYDSTNNFVGNVSSNNSSSGENKN
ncbi:MAG: hypothetical protein HGB14_11440, partial [Anaerolineaceae bacterium]|nr:hypothetical protein [Anaerolineaceae bacterium]